MNKVCSSCGGQVGKTNLTGVCGSPACRDARTAAIRERRALAPRAVPADYGLNKPHDADEAAKRLEAGRRERELIEAGRRRRGVPAEGWPIRCASAFVSTDE